MDRSGAGGGPRQDPSDSNAIESRLELPAKSHYGKFFFDEERSRACLNTESLSYREME